MAQLNRADVLAGALRLLESEGLDGLTMRRLATSLGVQAGGLYWHFRSKQDLLEAMADEIVADLGRPGSTGAGPDVLGDLARQLRTVLLRHRDGARVVAGTFVTQAHTRAAGEALMAALQAAGLPDEQGARVALALFSFVLGHTVEEQGMRALSPVERADRAGLPGLGPGAQVLLGELLADPGERFEFGLRLFLAGVAQEVGGAGSRPGGVGR